MENKVNLLTNAGLIYFFIRQENQRRIRPRIFQIANALFLTRRTVWRYLSPRSFLIKGKYMSVERRGRKYYYFVSCGPWVILQNVDNNSPESQFLTTRGVTLVHIIRNPGCTVKEIAEKRCLTRRSVWGIIGDLRGAELIRVEKKRRTHYYFFNDDQDFITRLNNEVREILKEILGTVHY